MQCPRCQQENPPPAKYCSECAAPLAQGCAKGGTLLPPTAKFCPECAHPVTGHPMAPPGYTSPQGYTPPHLAEKILTLRSALDGALRRRRVLAWARMRTGDPGGAVEAVAPIVSMFRAARFLGVEIFAPFLGEGYWRAGQYDEAARALVEMLDIAERCRMRFNIATGHRLLGEVALSANRPEIAEEVASAHFERAMTTLREIGAENELALAYAGYGRLHARQGNVTEARGHLTQALEIFERLGTLIEPDKVRAALAALPTG